VTLRGYDEWLDEVSYERCGDEECGGRMSWCRARPTSRRSRTTRTRATTPRTDEEGAMNESEKRRPGEQWEEDLRAMLEDPTGEFLVPRCHIERALEEVEGLREIARLLVGPGPEEWVGE
jgi:hypothetical protein